MARKPRHRPVHYTTFAFLDGAVTSCTPGRKPLPKRIKEDGLHIDADFVCMEYQSAPGEFGRWPDEQRVRFSDLLANRMNMRRAIRDIVMPVLADIQSSIEKLNKRLSEIERTLNKSSSD